MQDSNYSYNYLDKLPLELQWQIFKRTELAIISTGATASSLKNAAESQENVAKVHFNARYSSTALRFLNRSYELTTKKKIEGITGKPTVLQEIARLLASFDIKLAVQILDSISKEPYKSGAQKEIVEEILKFNKEEAFKIAQTINQYRYKAEALVSVAEEFAIQNKTEALKIADSIGPDEFKIEARIRIAKIRAIFDPDEAIEIAEPLDKAHKIKAYCEIVKNVEKKKSIIAQKLLEEASKMALSIEQPLAREEALTEIIDVLSPADLQKALDIMDATLKITPSSASHNHDRLFLSLVRFLLPLDREKAIDTFSRIKSSDFKDRARLEIVKNLAMKSTAKAREEATFLIKPENKDLALREIGLHLIENHIKEAFQLTQSINSEEHKNFLLREIVKKEALSDKAAAFEIAFSMKEGSPQQALIIAEILKVYALEEPKKVLEFLEKMESNGYKIMILLECAKAFVTQNPDFSTIMLDSAVAATHSLADDAEEKAVFFTEIAKIISTY